MNPNQDFIAFLAVLSCFRALRKINQLAAEVSCFGRPDVKCGLSLNMLFLTVCTELLLRPTKKAVRAGLIPASKSFQIILRS